MSWTMVKYGTEAEYRQHFEKVYCQGSLNTADGISVRFRKEKFEHCFFESSKRDGNKDTFSQLRAERVDWIKETLADGTADLKAGWDSKKKCYDHTRRVSLVKGNYVVVIALTGKKSADFVTAYVMDTPASLTKLTAAPAWKPPS
jgi:hypothetical protein